MSFPDVLSDYIQSHLAGLRVALPGRVVKYDKMTQRADVQPEIQDGELDEDEQRHPVTLPIVNDVPVVFPGAGGAGGWRLTFPIKPGDSVLLVFSSSSIARWKATGGGTTDPADDRRHHLSDAIAIPGMSATAPTEAPDDAIVLHGDKVLLGGPDADDPVVRKSDLANLVAEYKGHIHPDPLSGFTGVSTTGGAYTTPACSPTVKTE